MHRSWVREHMDPGPDFQIVSLIPDPVPDLDNTLTSGHDIW
jgi:hypothetical protein